jgi:hypothetical protein
MKKTVITIPAKYLDGIAWALREHEISLKSRIRNGGPDTRYYSELSDYCVALRNELYLTSKTTDAIR